MKADCPNHCLKRFQKARVVRNGFYYRTSDRRKIQRFQCAHCKVNFSQSSSSAEFAQKKRHLNHQIFVLLCSGVSQNRIARILSTQQKTVARKLEFLALRSRHKNLLSRMKKKCSKLQFDDLETFEHSKMKPLSITLMIEEESRFILGFEVSRMPAKGLLSKPSLKKYGFRADDRKEARERLFRRMRGFVSEKALIKSDQNPHYVLSVRDFFPSCHHIQLKGQRGAVTGQGELKKIDFDPLFSLNHTCAMFRANVNRLFRKTWCTTKKVQALRDHLELYVRYHNEVLLKRA